MSIVYLQQRLLGRFQGSVQHPPIQIVLIGLETSDELLVGWAHQRGCQLVAVPALGYEGSCVEDRCFHFFVGLVLAQAGFLDGTCLVDLSVHVGGSPFLGCLSPGLV